MTESEMLKQFADYVSEAKNCVFMRGGRKCINRQRLARLRAMYEASYRVNGTTFEQAFALYKQRKNMPCANAS
jgi:hypothetical protein